MITRLILILGFLELISCTEVDYDDWDVSDYALFPTLPIAAPWSEDKQCREDSRKLMVNLKNKTFWAMKMWDSSGKTESGQLYGNFLQGGQFDECLSVKEPVKSQYCGLSIRAYPNVSYAGGDPFELEVDPMDSVWRQFLNTRLDRSQRNRDNATWGLCIPASCSIDELLVSVNRRLDRVNAKMNGTVIYKPYVNKDHCQKMIGGEEFTVAEIGFWVTAFLLVLLVFFSSALDWMHPMELSEETKNRRLFMSFSLKRNFYKAQSMDEELNSSKQLKILYVLKFYTILLIILGHRAGLFFASGLVNYQNMEEHQRNVHKYFVPHSDLLVDSFFFISGLLGAFILLELYTKKFVNPILVMLGRYMRMAPVYFFMIWFHTSAIYRLGSGPAWVAIKFEAENCQENWWTNVLMINNYVGVDKSCMLHTWFIPAEFHLFVICVFLVLLLTKSEKLGLVVLGFLMSVSFLIPGALAYFNRLEPFIRFYPENLGPDIRKSLTWKMLYLPTHSRATVYFMGVFAAYVIRRYKSAKKLSHMWSMAGLSLSLALLFAPMAYGGKVHYDPRHVYDVVEAMIFASLRRAIWGLGCFAFILFYSFGTLPLVTFHENVKLYIPLSKLTFSMYLVHFYLISGLIVKGRIPYYYDLMNVAAAAFGDMILALLFGSVLYLGIELPFKVLMYEGVLRGHVEKARNEIEGLEMQTQDVKLYLPNTFSAQLNPPTQLDVKLETRQSA